MPQLAGQAGALRRRTQVRELAKRGDARAAALLVAPWVCSAEQQGAPERASNPAAVPASNPAAPHLQLVGVAADQRVDKGRVICA